MPKKLFVFAALFILIFEQLALPVRVGAIDDRIRQVYSDNMITTFDPNDCTLPGFENNGAVSLKGDTTIEQILNFFMSQPNGLTLAQAAGIVGNMAQESPHGVDEKTGVGLPNPAKEQGGAIVNKDYKPKNGVGFGLVQWTFTTRQDPLVNLATAENKPIIDLELQLKYVWQELNGGYKHSLAAIRNAKYPVEAAIAAHGPPWPGYEASADSPQKVRDVRGGNAQKIYDYYKDAPALGEPAESSEPATRGHSESGSSIGKKVKNQCEDSFAGGDLNETLLAYAWPNYRGLDINATEGYKTAVQKAMSDGRYVGGTLYKGIDCGGFVTLLLTDSGFEPEYNYGSELAAGAGNTTQQQAWMKANWERISSTDAGDRKPGDVAINGTHTYVYVGSVPGFEKPIASASWDERAPMAGTEGVVSTDFNWYRKKSAAFSGEKIEGSVETR